MLRNARRFRHVGARVVTFSPVELVCPAKPQQHLFSHQPHSPRNIYKRAFGTISMFSELTLSQKFLFIALCFCVGLMIVFSIGAARNLGPEGYAQCIQDVCDRRGEEICNKFRERNNCCIGAGGQSALVNDEFQCVF